MVYQCGCMRFYLSLQASKPQTPLTISVWWKKAVLQEQLLRSVVEVSVDFLILPHYPNL